MIEAAMLRIRTIWNVVRMVAELSRARIGLIAAFVVASVFNALTDGFTVMLVVPLVDTLASNSLFASIPLLGQFGALFEGLTVSQRLQWIALILGVIVLARGAIQYFLDIIVYVIPTEIEKELQARCLRSIMAAKADAIDKHSIGDLINMSSSFPIRVGIAARFLAQAFSSVVTIGILLLLMLAVRPIVLITIMSFILVCSVLFRSITRRVAADINTNLTRSQIEFSSYYTEIVQNFKFIKFSSAHEFFYRRLNASILNLKRIQIKSLALQAASYPFFSTVGGLLVCVIVLAASFFSNASGQEILAILVVFLVGFSRVLGPLSMFHISRNIFVSNVEAVEGLHGFLAMLDKAKEPQDGFRLSAPPESVAFDRVDFGYGDGELIVSDLSLNVPKGGMIAIVGHSGAGKSTILRLLMRLYRPTRGEILVNGVSLSEIAAETLWPRVGYVSQETPLFRGTVLENIMIADPEATLPQVVAAAQAASASAFIENLPDGFDTMIDSGGGSLSGGERQRIALARVFLKKPSLLILDEATSQLDTLTESAIRSAVNRLRESGCTVIVVAHRLATVQDADMIYVLSKGRIVEQGSHSALIKLDGVYSQMVATQRLEVS